MVLAFLELTWLHALNPLENRLSDWFVQKQAQKLTPDADIVMVDIDDASLARMQETAGSWPWPRSVHGELVRGIERQKPKAIVFDILFSERDEYRPDSDREFNRSLQGVSNVYFPMVRRDAELDSKGAPAAQVAAMLGLQRTAHADDKARIAILPPLAVDPAHWRTGTINFAEDRRWSGATLPALYRCIRLAHSIHAGARGAGPGLCSTAAAGYGAGLARGCRSIQTYFLYGSV